MSFEAGGYDKIISYELYSAMSLDYLEQGYQLIFTATAPDFNNFSYVVTNLTTMQAYYFAYKV
jgi:hypothetical protein